MRGAGAGDGGRGSAVGEVALIAAMLVAAHPVAVLVAALGLLGFLGLAALVDPAWLLASPLMVVAFGLADRVMRRAELPGRAVHPDAEPALAALVRDAAEQLGVQAPLLIRVVPTPDAAMVTTTVAGARTLVLILGRPFLRVLTEPQLAAVVAHELAHGRHADDRRSSWLVAARDDLAEATEHRVRVPAALADRLLRASQARCWALELAADADAARVAGRGPARAALERSGPIEVVFDALAERWITVLLRDGAYPEDLYDALAAACDDPVIARRAAAVTAADERVDALASHPPLTRRLAALPVPREAAAGAPHPVVLRDPAAIDRWCALDLAGPGGERLRPGRILDTPPEWFDLPVAEAREALMDATGTASAAAAVAATADAVAAGRWPELAMAIDAEIEEVPARFRPLAERDLLIGVADRPLAALLLDAGLPRASRWVASAVVLPDGSVADVSQILEDALATRDVAPVLALLDAVAARADR